MAKKSNIVRKKKSTINLLVIFILVIGWICTIFTLLDNSEEEEQLAYVQTAQELLADKLYVRAIKNYLSAINDYETEHNTRLEKELETVYFQAGMLDEYYELIEDRISAETADSDEYYTLAQKYIEEERNAQAIAVLQKGIARFEENGDLIQLQETVRYEYRPRTINLSQVIQPSENWLIPAFDGSKWGYMDADGDTAIDFIYEEATRFAGNYAVVKLDGVYTLIDQSGYWNAVDKNGLEAVTDISDSAIVAVKNGKTQIYSRTFQLLSEETFDTVYLNDNGLVVAQKEGKWAILSESLEPITEYIYTDVVVNSMDDVFFGDFAMVKDEQGYVLVNPEGKPMYEKRFVNAKGYEGGLIAVANEEGKWGYANGYGEQIIDYQYMDAQSFSCGLGAIKFAGKWGYINRYNTRIIEVQYKEAYPFVAGSTLAKTELGNHEILIMKHYELFE